MNLGDQITREFIRSCACPVHGEYCEVLGPFTPCRARIEQAKVFWHWKKIREGRS